MVVAALLLILGAVVNAVGIKDQAVAQSVKAESKPELVQEST